MVVEAKKDGIRKIVTETDPKNRNAYKFNIKNGFMEAGRISKLWGRTDAIVFIREIRE